MSEQPSEEPLTILPAATDAAASSENDSLVPVTVQTPTLTPMPTTPVAVDVPLPERPMLPLIIRGTHRMPVLRSAMPQPRHPLRLQTIIVLITVCLILITVFSQTVINGASALAQPFTALSALASHQTKVDPNSYFTYRVRSGDSIEEIANRFHVTINGIYKINHFYLGDEITVGQLIKIPNDPNYGGGYTITAPPRAPGDNNAPVTSISGSCLFCAIASNSTGGACAPNSTTNMGYQLIQPEYGAAWVRGFTWYHNGVDLSTGKLGTPIVAVQDGQVIFASWDPGGGGNSVKVNHCWGLSTSYSHMEKILVANGQFVHKGDIVGLQGSTGNSTGPHVHFMVWWHNQPVNPLGYYTHLGFPYP